MSCILYCMQFKCSVQNWDSFKQTYFEVRDRIKISLNAIHWKTPGHIWRLPAFARITLLQTTSEPPSESTGWGCSWGGAPLFSSRPSFMALVSLALTKPRWAAVQTFRMWHGSGGKEWVSIGLGEPSIWGFPPTVNTQHCTPLPSFYTQSSGGFKELLCARDKW